MDSEGIPQKIYRHIISAVSYFNYKLITGAYLSGIILLVRHFNSKLKPVDNIENTVKYCFVKLQALGLIIRRNNLFYLDDWDHQETSTISSAKKPSRPLNYDNKEEIPLDPESRTSTGSTTDLFKRIELKFEGWNVSLEKAIKH